MIKKILSWLMVVCLLLSYIPTAAFATETDGNNEPVATASAPNVAVVNDVGYTTLQAAIDAAGEGDTIVLMANVAENVTVSEGKTVILDLAGFDIVGTINAITNNGTLTINDSVGTGNVYTTDVSAQGRATIVNNGTLIINGGWFGDSNNDTTDRNAINRGNALKNYGTATINGGYFTNVSNQFIGTDAYAYAINNLTGGTITINNATVYGDINGLIFADGKVVVNDGSFTLGRPDEENNLWYLAYGNVEIKGGTWTRAFKVPSWNTGDPKFMGAVKVSGGVFNVEIAEAYLADGYVALPTLDGKFVVGSKPTATVNDLGMTTVAAGDYMVYGNGDNTADMPLSFVMQFLADQTAADMANSPFAEWYGDFVITFTGIENGSFTADGCYLAGHYGSFGWVKVPVDGMTIENGVPYPVMLGVGMGQKYDYICSSVQDFKCALYLTPEILAANPNIQVKLELAIVDNSEGGDAAANALINNENVYSVKDYTYDAEDFVVKNYVAQIGETKYESLAKAIAAAQNGDTIVLMNNIELTETVTIPAGKTITLDLNGKTLTYNSTVMGEAMITNKGTLTINDTVGTGVINYNYTGAADSTYGKGNYTISNAGTLIVNGGKITIANLRQHAKYPIDNNSTTGNAVLVINGGHLYNYNTSAIRQFCNSTVYKNSVTINGGLIEGYSAIWVQNPGKQTVNGTLTITGGEIRTTAAAYVNGTAELKDVSSRIYFTIDGVGGAWSEGSALIITGGIFNENVYLAKNAPANITIGEGATFNGRLELPAAPAPEVGVTDKVGGTVDVVITDNGDNSYNVKPGENFSMPAGGVVMTFPAVEGATDGAMAFVVHQHKTAEGKFTNYIYVGKVENGNITITNTVGFSTFTVNAGGLAEALAAAKTMTGNVTIEIYDKVILSTALSGSFDSIKFVGKDTDAEIYLDVQGYITATGKKVAFEDLILSKSEGGFIANAGFMNVAFGIYDVTEVTYTNCTFANGAYAGSGKVTYTGCTFKRSHDKYSLWAYGDVDITVDGCTFADYRGIKMYAEGGAKTVDLTVKNTNFSAVNNKPAIVLTYGESVTLENNTYSSTGVFELDLAGAPNGTTVTSDVAPTCKNDNGACGVLVDGKIYTTVAQAAEVAEEGSEVTLLYSTNETAEFPKNTTVNKADGVTAPNVTVAQPVYVAQIGEQKFETLAEAIAAADETDTIVVLADVTEEITALTGNIVSGIEGGVTITSTYNNWVYCGDDFTIGEGVTFKAGYMFVYCQNGMINGTVELSGQLYMRYADTKLTIQAPGKMIITGENAIIRYMGGDAEAGLYIIGDNDDSTVEFKAPYISFYSGILSAKDAVIEIGVLWQTNSEDGTAHGAAHLKLDNSKLKTTVDELVSSANANSKVELVNGSQMNMAGKYEFADSVELIVDRTSSVTAKDYTYEHPNYVAQIGDVQYESLQEALNAAAAATGNVTVEILTDIDLTGIDWTPVTISAPGYPVVTVNGNNKTITGLNDMLFAGTWAGNSGLIINDLTIKNSNIVNDENDEKGNVGVGAFIGFPQASATITLNNCHLVNSTVKGGHWTGGLIGYAAGYAGSDGPVFMNLTIKNCSVTDSTITGKGSVGGIIGHATGNGWTAVAIETTTVSGNTVTSTGSSTNKAGAVMGTIGAAGQATTVNGVEKTGGISVSATVSGNTVTSNGMEITTVYGRQGSTTGMLEIAGGSYDSKPIEDNVSYAAPAEGYKIIENTDGTYGIAVDPAYGKVAKIGENYYATLAEALLAAQNGDTIVLLADVTLDRAVTLTDIALTITGDYTLNANDLLTLAGTVSLNAPKLTGDVAAAGNAVIKDTNIGGYLYLNAGDSALTFQGDNKVDGFSASYYNNVITIGEGAYLEITGSQRLTIGWGNTFNITGTVENAKTADKSAIKPSLKVAAGITVNGSSALTTFNVTDAYIVLSSTCGTNNNATGKFVISFTNSIADLSMFKQQYAYGTYDVDFIDSVINVGANLVFLSPDAVVDVDNSNITVNSSFGNAGKFTLSNGSVMTVKSMLESTENGYNSGLTIVDNATLNVTGGVYSGYNTGKLQVVNGGVANINKIVKSTIELDADSTVNITTIDATSSIILGAGASMVAPEGLTVTTAEGWEVKYENGAFISVKPVAEVNGVKYDTLQEAIKAAQNGAIVTLLADIDVGTGNALIRGKEITIDLNGHNITGTGYRVLFVDLLASQNKDGKLTLVGNGTVENTGTTSGNSYAVYVGGNSELVVETGATVKSANGYAVFVAPMGAGRVSKLTVNGGTVTGRYAVSGSGQLTDTSTEITVNSGAVIGTEVGIYQPQPGTVTVNGGTVSSGEAALVMRRGAASITGGTIAGLIDVLGDYDATSVAITGGDFTNATLQYKVGKGNVVTKADAVELAAPADYKWVNGVLTACHYVAEVNGVKFESFLEALQYAIDNGASELKVLADVREKMEADFDLKINADLTITADQPVNLEFYNEGTTRDFAVGSTNNNTLTIGENVHFDLVDRVIWLGFWGNNVDVIVEGYLGGYQIWHGADTTVTATGTLDSHGEAFIMRRDATLTVNGGKVNANYFHIYSGHIVAEDATITAGLVWIYNNHNYGSEGTVSIDLDNTSFISRGEVKIYAGEGKTVPVTLTNGTTVTAAGALTLGEGASAKADATSSFTAKGKSIFVAEAGNNKYTSLQAAIDAAGDGATVTLLADINVGTDNALIRGKKITIDLNGYNITGTGYRVLFVDLLASQNKDGKLTLVGNGTVENTGTTSGNSYAVYVGGNSELVVETGATVKSANGYAVFVAPMGAGRVSKLTVNGGTVTGRYAVSGSGQLTDTSTVITVNSGAVIGTEVGIYHPQPGTVTVNGGTVSGGEAALAMRRGTASITGGTIVGLIDVVGDYDATNVAITGGDFTNATLQYADGNGNVVTKADAVELTAPADYKWVNGVLTACEYVAEINGVKFESLADAIAAAQAGDNVTLIRDVTASKIITISKGITLDGNGKTLTSTADRAINVSGANGVTIKNLTIDAKGERAINVIGNATNVTIDNVTATAANYTVNVAASAPNAVVTINGSTLNGLCTVNVAAAGAEVAIDNSTINCNDTNTTAGESYAALCLNKAAVGGSIIATNTTVNVTAGSDSEKGRNGAENGTVIINGSTEGVTVTVAVITYPGSDNYYGFTSLAAAIEFAKAGDTITLIRDVTLSDILVINKAITLDGNGKTLTSTAARAINVTGADGVTIKNLTINASGERAINIIQNATNVTIENVTATAANYTVNVASSAPGAVVAIKGSTLAGLCTVNVASAGANVTIDNSTINCNDNNTTAGESYAALCLNKAAVGGSIVATNTTVNVTAGSDSEKGRNGAENGTVIINGSTEGVTVTVAVITYPGSDNYYGFTSLAAAIEFAKAGDTITLIRDIELTEGVTVPAGKNITLDLNGNDITMSVGDVTVGTQLICNKGTLTITDSAEVDGEICLTYTGAKNGSVSISTIRNEGVLNIAGGIINCVNGNQNISYAIDAFSFDGNGTVNISGGTVKGGASGYCIRMFLSGAANTLNVTGGKVGYVWAQQTNANANKAEINVTGGYVDYVYVASAAGACDVSNVTLNVKADCTAWEPYVGGDGTYALEEVDGVYKIVKKVYVAEVNGKKYESLQKAINVGGEIKLLADIELTEGVVIAAGQEVVLDLNGKTISGTETETLTANDALIRITKGGKLTIKDSSEEKTGSITYGYTGEATGWGGYSASTIENNQGTLIVESGKIVSTTNMANQIAYAINTLTNGNIGDAYVCIKGGEIVAAGSTAVRQFANSTTCTNTLVIEGGKITGRVQLQSSNANNNKGVLTITGGEIIREGNTAIEVWFSGGANSAYSETVVSIGGAVKVTGNVVFDEAPEAYNKKVISGGTFNTDVSEFVADGYECTANGDGTYGVEEKPAEMHTPGTPIIENIVKGSEGVNPHYDSVVYCTECGEEISRETIHLSENVFAGMTMALDESLEVKFVVHNNLLSGSGYYATIIRSHADGASDEVVTITQDNWFVYTSKMDAFAYSDLAARDMIDVFTVILYNAEGEIVGVYTDSMREYAMRKINEQMDKGDAKNVKALTLFVDILNYGAEAQIRFNHATGDLANKYLTAEHQQYATPDQIGTDNQIVTGAGFRGTTLSLENRIELNFIFFNDVVTRDMRAEITYKSIHGHTVTEIIDGTDFVVYDGKSWRITIGMALADGMEMVTCTIYDGETVVATAQDSMEGYLTRKYESAAIMHATWKVIKSAKDYLGK